jgi:hypothetical protein
MSLSHLWIKRTVSKWTPEHSAELETEHFAQSSDAATKFNEFSKLPSAAGTTTINTIAYKGKPGLITNTYILKILRTTCSSFGGKATFGFDSHEIGNKSIRSGAAMALFINDISQQK